MLTVNMAAKILGFHPITIRRAIASGELISERHGWRVLISREALKAYLLAHWRKPIKAVIEFLDDPTPGPVSPTAEDSHTTSKAGNLHEHRFIAERNYSPEARAETRSRSEVFVGAE